MTNSAQSILKYTFFSLTLYFINIANVPASINAPSPIASPPTLQEEYTSIESFTSNKPDEENFGPSPTDQPVTELGNISQNFYKNDKDEVVYDQGMKLKIVFKYIFLF